MATSGFSSDRLGRRDRRPGSNATYTNNWRAADRQSSTARTSCGRSQCCLHDGGCRFPDLGWAFLRKHGGDKSGGDPLSVIAPRPQRALSGNICFSSSRCFPAVMLGGFGALHGGPVVLKYRSLKWLPYSLARLVYQSALFWIAGFWRRACFSRPHQRRKIRLSEDRRHSKFWALVIGGRLFSNYLAIAQVMF